MEILKLTSNYDMLDIYAAASFPEEEPSAVVQIVHGMCGCKERYQSLMNFLSDNGCLCVASDLRGHGQSVKSPNDRGYFYSGGYKALVDDVRIVSDFYLQKFPDAPLFLLGHSMGSMAARIYAKQDDSKLSGLILCGSPSKNPGSNIGAALTGIICMAGFEKSRPGIMQNMMDNKYNKKFASEGHRAWTCSDTESREQSNQMPQCNFNFTINGTNNLMKMMCETYSPDGWKVSNPTMPILFISGENDPCMISKSKFYEAINAMRRVGYTNVKYSIYPEMRHEVLHEVGKQNVWNQILSFVKTHQKQK